MSAAGDYGRMESDGGTNDSMSLIKRMHFPKEWFSYGNPEIDIF